MLADQVLFVKGKGMPPGLLTANLFGREVGICDGVATILFSECVYKNLFRIFVHIFADEIIRRGSQAGGYRNKCGG